MLEHAHELFLMRLSQVDVQYQRMMKRFVPLSELKKYHLQHRAQGGPLKDMALFTRARLSVQPLTTGESGSVTWVIVSLGNFTFLSSASSYCLYFLQRSLNLSWVWRIKHLCEDLPPSSSANVCSLLSH